MKSTAHNSSLAICGLEEGKLGIGKEINIWKFIEPLYIYPRTSQGCFRCGQFKIMDPIKKLAENFMIGIESKSFTLEKIDSEITSKLLFINKNSEKLRFLSYLRSLVEIEYQEHIKDCTLPDQCSTNRSYENALYSIKQQYDDYLELIEGFSLEERPAMQFFSKGQYFDSYSAFRNCLKDLNNSIILIDNYVSDATLQVFAPKEPMVKFNLITKPNQNTNQFARAVEVYNKQFLNLELYFSDNYHDRFLIIDNARFYHIGSSIKDAGNKAFMFTQILDLEIIQSLRVRITTEFPNLSI